MPKNQPNHYTPEEKVKILKDAGLDNAELDIPNDLQLKMSPVPDSRCFTSFSGARD